MSRVSYRRPPRERQPDQRRMMARPLHEPRWVPEQQRDSISVRRLAGPASLVLIAGVALVVLLGLASGPPAQLGANTSPSPSASPSAVAGDPSPSPAPTLTAGTPRPSATSGSSGVGTPRVSPSARPDPTASSPPPTTSPSPTGAAGGAPRSAAEFDQLGGEVIDMAFPFKPQTRYDYRDNWWDVRAGSPDDYNHARARRGEVIRAHDGIDIYARRGSAVVAPFAGTVIDPAERWSPWHPERYGGTVVVVSSEPHSEGYAAILSHLDAVFVEPGTQVRRGEVVGLAGNTGNAEETRVHLHFELRARFQLPWLELGGERMVDAFNPYPSLIAADPKRD